MSAAPTTKSGGADTAAIVAFLRRLKLRNQILTYAALIGGTLLAMLGPLCILLFYLLFSLTLLSSYGFWGAYCRIAAVTLPIFFLMAYWLRGSVLERWVPDGDTLSGRFMRKFVAPTLIILEIANGGPRLILWAIDRLRGQYRVRGASLPRIAQAIGTFLKIDSGISPAALLLPGEPPDRLAPLLAFLLYHQIVDLSKQGDRVWLVSHWRRELERFGR